MGQKNSAPARRSDSSSRDNNQRSPNSGKRLQLSNLRVVSLEEYADRLNHKISDLYLCNNLIRSLPAELVIAAPNLETIDVSGNLLEEIPAELGELERLRQLVLFSNRIKVIPAPIFNALALTFLELSGNQISELPETLTALQNLSEFNVVCNFLPDVPDTFGALTSLSSLKLRANKIVNITDDLSRLEKLAVLDLRQNFLEMLPTGFLLPNATKLLLSENKLHSLPSSFSELYNVSQMEVSNNALTSLFDMSNVIKMEKLWLDGNKLQSLPATIGALENLVELNLCENELTSLPPQIKGLSMLVSLLLNRNQLKELPDEIGELRYLLILEVGMNKLKKLPRSIGNLTNLDKLVLDVNNLSRLPSEISQLTKLKVLTLGLNKLDDKSFKKPLFEEMTQMLELRIYGNPGITQIPEDVYKLQSLERLFMGNNSITSVQDSMTALTKLRHVHLAFNNLTEFPMSFLTMTNLQCIWLNSNKIKALPPQISNLLELNVLDLSMNELEEIPSSIGQLKQLHEFNLSRNKLKTLPAEVGLMEELFALDVSFNKDFSKVPHELYPLYTLTNAKFLYCNLAELPNTRSDSDLVGMKWMCLEGNKITELPLKVQGLTDIPPNYEASQTTYPEDPSDIDDTSNLPATEIYDLDITEMQGVRPTMEDSMIIRTETPLTAGDKKFKLLGVFDGHADSAAAELAAVTYHEILERELRKRINRKAKLIRKESQRLAKRLTSKETSKTRASPITPRSLPVSPAPIESGEFMKKHKRRSKQPQGTIEDAANALVIDSNPATPTLRKASTGTSDIPEKITTTGEAPTTPKSARKRKEAASGSVGESVATTPRRTTKSEKLTPTSIEVSTPRKTSKAVDKLVSGTPTETPDVSASSVPGTLKVRRAESNPDLPAEQLAQLPQLDMKEIVPLALEQSFTAMRERTFDLSIRSGFTIVVALLYFNRLWIANAGDARATICKGTKAERLSFDHKAQDPDERLRVQKLGGFLGDNNRIAGKIAIARSIGDHEFFPLVSSDPFISLTELTPEYKFLIVACDGLWDVMSDQEAVDFVVEYHNKTKSYVGAALLLRDLAFQLGSGDNISIIVFGLHTPELPVCPPPVSSDDAKAAPYEPVSFGNTPTETSLQDVVPPAVSSSATFETIVEESDEPESASFVNAPLAKAEAEVESTSVPAHKEEPKE